MFRTVERKNQSEGEDALSSLTIRDTLSRNGVSVNYKAEPALSKCKENQIYLMDKQKMFLVSSEKIVHDISGLAKFEDNLVRQIKNQDDLIKTLKTRLSASESQDVNLVKILNSLRTNEKTRLTELKETKEGFQSG